jgi:hypothetical protein
MADATNSLWRYLLDPRRTMSPGEAERLRPAMARLAMLSSPATAAWLLAPVLPANAPAIPPDEVVRDRLRTRYLRAEARRWLAAISAAGIPVLPLKGFATALAIYPAVELRGLGDVDLLLREADLARLVALLRGEGFEFRKSQGTAVWGLVGDASFDPCVAPDRQLAFDLHIHPDDFPVHRSLGTEKVFAAARVLTEEGLSLRVPCDDHLFLLAASNAARDKYDMNAVRSVVDMAAMAMHGANLVDWPAALALATAGGYGDAVRLAAQLLVRLGLPPGSLPSSVLRPFRGLAAWELARVAEDFEHMFEEMPSKLALQRREWLLTGGARVAAWRNARRLRGLIRPRSGVPQP